VSHRPRFRMILPVGAALACVSVLPGCIALLAGGAGAAGGYALGQELPVEQQFRDKAIRSEVSQSWAQFNFELSKDLDATLYDGRVLVTGRVPSEDWHQEGIRRTWQVKGVKEVYDEVEVGPGTSFGQDARDTLVSTRLRSAMLADGNVRSINYTVTTVNGTVYLIGSARGQSELDRVTDYARNIANVRRVVSYVRIRPGDPNGAPAVAGGPSGAPVSAPVSAPASASAPTWNPGPAAAPAPTWNPPTPTPYGGTPPDAPTPRRSIEVTPLN
jgi:osmotically-inducible protein OsmY